MGEVFAVELPPIEWADSDHDTLDDLWELSWTTEPGRTYRVQTREDLSEAWVLFGEPVSGNGRPARVPIPAFTGPQRYYQVTVAASPNP